MDNVDSAGEPKKERSAAKLLTFTAACIVAVVALLVMLHYWQKNRMLEKELGQASGGKNQDGEALSPEELLLRGDGVHKPNVVKIDPLDGPKIPNKKKEPPKTRYPGLPAASKTARRAATLDLRNPGAFKIAQSLWKHEGKIIKLTLIKGMQKADNQASAAWLKEIVEAPTSATREEDIRGHAIAALAKMKHSDAKKFFYTLDQHADERVRIFYATSLGYLKDKKSEDQLKQLLKSDQSQSVRKAAETSLAKRKK